jgi:hypothetical protein
VFHVVNIALIALSTIMNLCTVILASSLLPETNLELKSNVNVAMDKYPNEDSLIRQVRESKPFVRDLWNGIQWLSTPLTPDQEGILLRLASGSTSLTEEDQRTLCRGIEEQCAISQRTRYSLGRN